MNAVFQPTLGALDLMFAEWLNNEICTPPHSPLVEGELQPGGNIRSNQQPHTKENPAHNQTN